MVTKKFLMIFAILMLSITLVSAFEFDNVKGFVKDDTTSKYGKIVVTNAFGLGGVLGEYELLINTDQCLIDCYAVGTVDLKTDDKLFTNLRFIGGSVRNGNIFIEHEVDKIIIENIYGEEICKYNEIIKGQDCSKEITGTKEKIIKVKEWKLYEGEVLVEGKYKWKIEGKKNIKDDVDWIVTGLGEDLEEWAWWNSNWGKKKEITLTSPDSKTRANVSVIINIDYESSMMGNFTDLRFVDEEEDDELGYWFYNNSYYTSDNVTIMVKLNRNISSASTETIYVYYGNSIAPLTQNISRIGMFGDDFIESPNWAGDDWFSANQGLYSVSGGILSMASSGGVGTEMIETQKKFSNFIMEAKVKRENTDDNARIEYIDTSTNWANGAEEMKLDGDGNTYVYVGGGGNTVVANDNEWKYFKTEADGTYANRTLRHENGTYFNTKSGTTTETSPYIIAMWSYGSGKVAQVDWIYITGYLNGSVSSSFGSEQTSNDLSVNLIYPQDNFNSSSSDIEFYCYSNDSLGVSNISLVIDGSFNVTETNVTAGQNLSLNTTLTMGDGSYNWSCYADDEEAGFVQTAGRNLTIDSTPPNIFAVENLTNLTSTASMVNSTWNFNVTDPHIQACWYNTTDNATITIVTCNSTIYTQWETEGEKTVYYFANDSFGNLNDTESKLINIGLINIDYAHTPDSVGEGGNVFFELYVNQTNIATTSAYLWINGTQYNPDNSDAHTNYYYFNYTLAIPDTWGNSTGKWFDYYWNYSIAGLVANSSTQTDNFTVFDVSIDDCSTNGEKILNLSLFDEETNDFVNATAGAIIEVEVNVSKGSYSWFYHNEWVNNQSANQDDLNVAVCIPYEIINNTNYSIDFTIGFESTDHVWEFFYLENGTLAYNYDLLNSLTNKTLYLRDLLSADSTSFLFNYFDLDGLIVDDIRVHVFRKYIGEGVFREVERAKQNDDGDMIVHLVEEDVLYYFVITDQGEVLFTSSTYTALCQATPCEIQLEESGDFIDFNTTDWDLIDNGGYTLNALSTTRQVNLTYSLTTPSLMNLTVYKLDSDGAYSSVGSSQEIASSGEILITVPTVSGNTTFFATVYQDGNFKKSSWIDFEEDAGLYFGNTLSLFLGALIILALGLMAVAEGSATMIFLILGMFLAMVLGLVDYRTSTGLNILIYFIIAGGIIIWKLTRRNR